MIVYRNKNFMQRDNFPDTDWVGNADWVLNDNDPADAEIEEKIISLYPNFDFVFDENGKIADVIETEHEAVPEPPTNAELAAAIAELAEVMCGG
ncbi:MAG: hypothetical protein PUH30_01955 [Oscillospiraceae bacterium]|nr:hypothetical protein [Oscillospiraceae bacterium]